jgi:hypothetical protein
VRSESILWTSSLNDALFSFPLVALAFLSQFNMLAVHASLANPTRARVLAVINRAILCCTVVFSLFGSAGYLYERASGGSAAKRARKGDVNYTASGAQRSERGKATSTTLLRSRSRALLRSHATSLARKGDVDYTASLALSRAASFARYFARAERRRQLHCFARALARCFVRTLLRSWSWSNPTLI